MRKSKTQQANQTFSLTIHKTSVYVVFLDRKVAVLEWFQETHTIASYIQDFEVKIDNLFRNLSIQTKLKNMGKSVTQGLLDKKMGRMSSSGDNNNI